VSPSTAATNCPDWSLGAPVGPGCAGGLVAGAVSGQDLRAADQDTRVDAERPTDQSQHRDSADTQTADGAASHATPILDIVAAAKIIPKHVGSPLASQPPMVGMPRAENAGLSAWFH